MGAKIRLPNFIILPILLLVGCEPSLIIQGHVTDTQGTGLPGAAVTIVDTTIQASTDARGDYALSCPKSYLGGRETLILSVIKSGYGSTRINVRASGTPPIDAPVAALWQLPPTEGLFLLDGHRYQRTTPANIRRYITEGAKLSFGTKKTATLQVTEIEPRIFSYRMYGYDLQLVRLEEIQAVELPEGESLPASETDLEYNETIWAAAEEIATTASPIDEPERFLYEVRARQPLAPGHYALHWGALDGFLTTDPRIFLFDVVEEAPAEETDTESAAEEGGDR